LFGGGDVWLRGAVATAAAGLVAMFVLVVLAGATAAGPSERAVGLGAVARHAAKASLVAIATALAAAAWFVIGFPGLAGAHLDRGAVFYAIAIVVGVIAAIRALRWRR
jgi:hypothetical protein